MKRRRILGNPALRHEQRHRNKREGKEHLV
jgi:hypothetical protein